MFEFDAGKLLIIGIVALVVIGPKDLPRVLRQVGQMVSRLRRMAGDFQSQFMDAMREAELEDIRKDVEKATEGVKSSIDFNPIADVHREISGALADRPAEIAGAPQLDLDVPKFTNEEALDASAAGAAPVAEPSEAEPVALAASEPAMPEPAVAVPATPVFAEAIAPVATHEIEHRTAEAVTPQTTGPH
jgi:sec-independent protein translocase protein TatB